MPLDNNMPTWLDVGMTNFEERKIAVGHHHIEGYCAVRSGRTWTVKREGCQMQGTDNPCELAHYSSSLDMVRNYIWGQQDGRG